MEESLAGILEVHLKQAAGLPARDVSDPPTAHAGQMRRSCPSNAMGDCCMHPRFVR